MGLSLSEIRFGVRRRLSPKEERRLRLLSQGLINERIANLEDVSPAAICKFFSRTLPVSKSLTANEAREARVALAKKLLEGYGEVLPSANVAAPQEPTNEVKSKVIESIRFGHPKYLIRETFGLTNDQITKINCEHYQRRAVIGESA